VRFIQIEIKNARKTMKTTAPADYHFPDLGFRRRRSRLKSSASFTKRQSGSPSPSATEQATLTLGLRSARSIKEIIFDARSARSASSSWVSPFAFRCFRTASAENLAKSFDNTPPFCQPQKGHLQEQLFHFIFC
jgi:hypothetical protein